MIPITDSCCFKFSNRTGSVVIGTILFVFCVAFTFVAVGLIAGWEDFDTQFLDDRLARYLTVLVHLHTL